MNIENVPSEKNFNFSLNTTYGCGGSADIAYFPESIRQAEAVYNYLTANKIKFVTLGNGSNVLASGKRFDGAVICTKGLKGIYRYGNSIFCRAGTKVGALLKYCIDNGLSGLEHLAGIPATMGGLVYMNGGAGGKYICDNVISVKLFDGKIRNFSNEQCNFGYKYSTMRDINSLILGVRLEVKPENSEIVRKNVGGFLEKRKWHPKGKSCGCVFKNPDGLSAGKLIDEAGLKGFNIGGAEVSREHANFILNNGARPEDIYSLIKEVKRIVNERTGIMLEEEVVYIGDF